MKPEIEDALKWIDRLIHYPSLVEDVTIYSKIVHAHIVEQDTAIAKLKRKLFIEITVVVILYAIMIVAIYGIVVKP